MKKLSLIALVAVMLAAFSSCKYKNPALENSQNPMVKEFEVANLLLGSTKAEAEKTLKELGYTSSEQEGDQFAYERKDGDVEIELLFRVGSKKKIFVVGVVFEPMAAETYLNDFAKCKEVVTTFGKAVKISTKEECAFNTFVNSAGVGEQIDYETMLSRIDSSTNGFDCLWLAGSGAVTPEMLENGNATAVLFDCSSSDYRSYSAVLEVITQKYK